MASVTQNRLRPIPIGTGAIGTRVESDSMGCIEVPAPMPRHRTHAGVALPTRSLCYDGLSDGTVQRLMRVPVKITTLPPDGTKCTDTIQTGGAVMLDLSPDPQAARDEQAFGAAPAASGRYASDNPPTGHRHSWLWWLLVAVAFIL
jgi:hypothetical protein